jgi:hypothetical protein
VACGLRHFDSINSVVFTFKSKFISPVRNREKNKFSVPIHAFANVFWKFWWSPKRKYIIGMLHINTKFHPSPSYDMYSIYIHVNNMWCSGNCINKFKHDSYAIMYVCTYIHCNYVRNPAQHVCMYIILCTRTYHVHYVHTICTLYVHTYIPYLGILHDIQYVCTYTLCTYMYIYKWLIYYTACIFLNMYIQMTGGTVSKVSYIQHVCLY